jgi:hypothetical protein
MDLIIPAEFSMVESIIPNGSLEIEDMKWILLRQLLSVSSTPDSEGKIEQGTTNLAEREQKRRRTNHTKLA